MQSILPNNRPSQVLRNAARGLRDDVDRRIGGDDRIDDYNKAVAEWLEHTAKLVDNVPDGVSPATPERLYANAFFVARAYLSSREVR